jgi:hypothetical protein
MNEDRNWTWIWSPVIALGYLIVVVAKASMTSIFDED